MITKQALLVKIAEKKADIEVLEQIKLKTRRLMYTSPNRIIELVDVMIDDAEDYIKDFEKEIENLNNKTMSMSSEEATKEWAAQEFGIPVNEIVWYNSGSCYDRIGVTTKESADKVSAKVEGQVANGGMLDGMPLGGQTYYPEDEKCKVGYYDVTC